MENILDEIQSEVVAPEIEEVETEVVESVASEVATDTQEEVEKVVQTPEENAVFADQRRKYEAEKSEATAKAKDDLIAEMYGESHGINTVKEYEEAMAKQKEQAEITAIQEEKNYSEEDAKDLFEARQIKAEKAKVLEAQNKTEQQKAAENQQNIEFLDYFKSEQGREFNIDKDNISQEVWDIVKSGTPLKYAYMQNEIKQLKLGTTVAELNADNAQSTIGSVKGDGAKIDGPLTEAQIENMSQTEMMARWPEVKKVLGMI